VIDGKAAQPFEYIGEEPVAEESEPGHEPEGNNQSHWSERLYAQSGMSPGWFQSVSSRAC
jgi:hypothetical protein